MNISSVLNGKWYALKFHPIYFTSTKYDIILCYVRGYKIISLWKMISLLKNLRLEFQKNNNQYPYQISCSKNSANHMSACKINFSSYF